MATSCEIGKTEAFSLEILSQLDCPYTWNLGHSFGKKDTESLIKDLERIVEGNIEAKDETIASVITYLVLAHERANSGNYEVALEILDKAIKNSEVQALQPFCEALNYVINAEKAHILYRKGDKTQALEHIKKCPTKINNELKCVIKGIEGGVNCDYFPLGYDKAKTLLKQAIEFETDSSRKGEWYLMLGYLYSRQRHALSGFTDPTEEEVLAVEKAHAILQRSSSKLLVANVYLDKSKSIFRSDRENGRLLCQTAFDLCNDTLKDCRNHPRILSRCATLLLHFPGSYKNVKLAEETYKEALILSPDNPLINYSLGRLYELHKNNLAQAEWYYERSAKQNILQGDLSLISVRWKRNQREYNPIPPLKDILQNFNVDEDKIKILIQTGSYYWFVKHDLEAATKEWMAALKLQPHEVQLKQHISFFTTSCCRENILEILETELQAYLQKGNDPEKKLFFRECLCQISKYKRNSAEEVKG